MEYLIMAGSEVEGTLSLIHLPPNRSEHSGQHLHWSFCFSNMQDFSWYHQWLYSTNDLPHLTV